MNLAATTYFQTIYDLSQNLLVSDHSGAPLPLDEGAMKAVKMIMRVASTARKVMLIGNGGSAAIACHTQNDLCNAVGVPAMVYVEPSLLTALSNDHGYEHAFERSVQLWANNGDLLLAISSSGQSTNILRTVRVAIERSCQVITFSGFLDTNPLRRLGHLNFYVPAQVYGHVEMVHASLAHYLTDCAVMSRQEGREESD